MPNIWQLIFLGPPAAGKGTLAHFACTTLQLASFSTGQALRTEVASQSELGKNIAGYMQKSAFVPDELVCKLVASWVASQSGGYILDGFPRTLVQAKMLLEMIERSEVEIDALVWLQAPYEQLLSRIVARRECTMCGLSQSVDLSKPEPYLCPHCHIPLVQRADDTEEFFAKRWADYQNLTMPVAEYLSSRIPLVTIDATQSISFTQKQLLSKLGNLKV